MQARTDSSSVRPAELTVNPFFLLVVLFLLLATQLIIIVKEDVKSKLTSIVCLTVKCKCLKQQFSHPQNKKIKIK
jgi:hypothetical protein